ncbi:MAG: pyruvate formate lyase family protein, partial [Bacteroidota bacterium]
MNNRINKLREQSQNAEPRISAERALLITDFYKSKLSQQVSVPKRRALAFKHILSNKSICILDDELIVGERGPAPKVVPTYPEINLHSLEDLHILDTRPKVWFSVDDETKEAYRNIVIPFWKEKTNREKIFANLDRNWIDAYEAGVFTEFQEQRAPGHTVLGKKMFSKGFLDLKKEISSSIASLDFFNDKDAYNKREELKAMDISVDAIIHFANRHADKLELLSENELDENRKIELMQMS